MRTWISKFGHEVQLLGLLLLFTYFQVRQAQIGEWGDESETLVVSRMLHGGDRLYSEIFNQHGPLTFLIPFLMESLGPQSVFIHRLPVILWQIALLVLVYKSKVHKTKSKALLSAVLFALYFGYISPAFLGNTMEYQTLAGLAISTVLITSIWPRLVLNQEASRKALFLGIFLSISLSFLAFIYIPVTLVFSWLLFRRNNRVLQSCAYFVAFFLNILWVLVAGDMRAFIVDHVYFNAVIMKPYFGDTGTITYISAILNMLISKPSLVLAFIALFLLMLSQLPTNGFSSLKVAILMISLATLLTRGDDFHATPFFHGAASLLVLIAPRLDLQAGKWLKLLSISLVTLLCLRFTGVLPSDQAAWSARSLPYETELSKLVGELTSPEDRIIVYTFRNYEYLVSNRLPASSNFFYFPWQADYEKGPILGVHYDVCRELNTSRPKIISLDRWTVWGAYQWNTYAQCVDALVNNRTYYFESIIPGTYVRSDLRSIYESTVLKN